MATLSLTAMDPENPAPPSAPMVAPASAGFVSPPQAGGPAVPPPQEGVPPVSPPPWGVPPSVSPPPSQSAGHPSFIFLAALAILSLGADVATKTWAEKHLDSFPGLINVWKDHIAFILAKNRGGAWGLLQGTSENVRRPFFLLVSVAAIAFIVTLYRRLLPTQRALKWGLPLVLGGALGNVFDRIRYGHVIDFIDVHLVVKGRDHHWPTFNVADIAICVGVGLMAVDMFTSKRSRLQPSSLPPSGQSAPLDAPDAPPPVNPGPGPTALVAATLPVSPSAEDKT